MRIAAVVVAAGRGTRAGEGGPKQYRSLGGIPVLQRTLDALLDHPGIDRVLAVIHPDDREPYAQAVAAIGDRRLCPPVTGGPSRSASVRQGLEHLAADPPDAVLIHDAARPFVARDLLDRLMAALETAPAAFPALPVADALWRAEAGLATQTAPRDGLWRAQTPQCFRFGDILAAHRNHRGPEAADDVATARAAGLPVRIVPGDGNNFKITLPGDFARAERLLRGLHMDIRTGQGFDVHAFGPGDHVTLGGVAIPYPQGLSGHSDADVALHAITDAVFGALAEGDIGQWFPPGDPQWKGAASEIFLARAVERATARGFAITSIDCTILAEAPKIGPHSARMRANIARIAGITEDRVGMKATTAERLGFVGRGEGIAALAVATLVAR